MIEKYKDRLKEILSDEKVVKKRRSTKHRSAKKRRSTKRRSTKRRSRFGVNETLNEKIEKINNIANAKVANADENDDDEEEKEKDHQAEAMIRLPRKSRNSVPRKNTWQLEPELAESEVAEAEEALAEAAEAEAEAEEAPPKLPIAPKAADEARRPSSKWPTAGVRGPAPPPSVGFNNNQVPVVGSSLSAARAQKFKEGVRDGVRKLLEYINRLGGNTTFGQLFTEYEETDSLNAFLMFAKRDGLIEYIGGMLFQGQNDDVVITLTEKAKEMLQN